MKMHPSSPALPRLVEVVGPAGAGKSTICQSLAAASRRIHLDNFPNVRDPADAAFFARNGFRTMPALLRVPGRNSRTLSRREFAWLSILNGWPELLQRQMDADHRTILLDQGPVYLLTELTAFGPEHLRNRPTDRSLQSLFEKWASLLDAVIWLDAPNEVLIQRIRSRKKEHVVKGKAAGTALAFLDQFRAAYARTLSLLAAEKPDLRIVLFDTEQRNPDQITTDLLLELALQP